MKAARIVSTLLLVLVFAAYWYYQGSVESPPASGPAAQQSGESRPGESRPGASQPGASQPGTSQPGTSQPGASGRGASSGRSADSGTSGGGSKPRGHDEILEAYRNGESDRWVEAAGRVSRLLPDDNEGSRHQKFIVRLANDHTILISHNIDLAPYIDLQVGDAVAFRGEYEWNDRGGVVHWTHHDPRGRREGGWIDHDGRRYR